MKLELTPQQKNAQAEFRAFVDAEVLPDANRHDQEERTPPKLIEKLAQKGYLGAVLPKEFGGKGMDMITYGLLNEEIGRGCSSLRSLLTVHCMVAHALCKWGSKSQKDYWIPKLAFGEAIAAFGLSEPNVGSDAKSVETTAKISGGSYVLNGQKKWITYGQIADVFWYLPSAKASPLLSWLKRTPQGSRSNQLLGCWV